MGTPSLFALNPTALLSAVGLWRGPDPTVPTPVERWQDATVDVVIHADRHQHSIAYCLAALARQTLRPRQVMLVDDGGSDRDHTVQIAREFAHANGMSLAVVGRMWSIGRAPTLKRQARELDGDVLFALDGDTVLESPDYIERCVRELYQGVGIASATGAAWPMRASDRRAWAAMPEFRRWVGGDPYLDPLLPEDPLHRLLWWAGNAYRETVAGFQQQFLNRGLMALVGGVAHRSGSAVAYRRRYLKDVFDRYEPVYGDDLTGLPDLFIGFALNNVGYRNLQLAEVQVRTIGGDVMQLPAHARRETLAFLQAGHDFDSLLRSPLRWPRRWWGQWRQRATVEQPGGRELRRVAEAYRQPFGERLTRQHGRPIGWALFFGAVEKVVFPIGLMALAVLGQWAWLAAVVAAEMAVAFGVLLAVTPRGRRGAMLGKAVLFTPLRYALMLQELGIVLGFALKRSLRTRRLRR
ncbi:glycosyltransferase [Lysobacter sp. A3-1-A15]|uniref:glycosyltransferase n=1 Tax=Novilysobacter viscosus TaxID=3098602 RepID=UPI002ED814E2